MEREPLLRLLVFCLASMSFACLIGTFYGWWKMKPFACYAYVPAIVLLAVLAWKHRRGLPGKWIIWGAVGGIVAALAYDLFRLPFVLGGAPLFKPFAHFGELLLGQNEPRWLVQSVGWSYHFSNGAALGIMFLAALWKPTPKRLFWGAVVWALTVEAFLLMTPYTSFFGMPFDRRFVILTVSAHLVFGLVLGWWCMRRTALVSTSRFAEQKLR